MMSVVSVPLAERMSNTAMVSPSARLNPSKVAPTMPLLENGRMTSVIMPHRVPPSAKAASHVSRGVCAITSRVSEVITGVTMIDTTTPQMKMEFSTFPGSEVRKIGTKLR